MFYCRAFGKTVSDLFALNGMCSLTQGVFYLFILFKYPIVCLRVQKCIVFVRRFSQNATNLIKRKDE